MLLEQTVNEVRSCERQIAPLPRLKRKFETGISRLCMFRVPDSKKFQPRAVEIIARRARRSPLNGVLRNDTQGQCLRERKLRGFAAEIYKTRGSCSLDILAVRGKIKICFEQLLLAVVPFELQCAGDLNDLPGESF